MCSTKQEISVRSVSALDNKKNTWWQAHRPTTRRLVQFYSALLHNAYLRGFIEGDIYQGSAKYACTPGLNCYSCPAASAACPLGSLQNALSSLGHRAGWYVLGILLLYGVILGRTICGWLCPLGLIQELLHKIPTPKIRRSRTTRICSYLKYVILAMFVAVIPIAYGLKENIPLPAFCKYICPAGTLEGAVGLLSNSVNTEMFGMLGILFTRKFVIMMMIGLLCVFLYRSFCRFLCPLGAIYGLFNRYSVIGVKVDAGLCNHCGACVRSCGMDVRMVGDHECIHCAKCMDVCVQGAISLKAGKITLKAPEPDRGKVDEVWSEKSRTRGRIVRGMALTLLCFALLWFNVLDPSIKERDESTAPVGFEAGNQLADFSIDCLDGTRFHLADTRGKIVFINLWATYCEPCVKELPYFDELYRQHEDETVVLAVHSSLVTQEPKDFLAGKDYAISFATDTADDQVWKTVDGGPTLPQTIVLNRRGEVIYNKVGSVTPKVLAALYEEAAVLN